MLGVPLSRLCPKTSRLTGPAGGKSYRMVIVGKLAFSPACPESEENAVEKVSRNKIGINATARKDKATHVVDDEIDIE